MWLEIWLVFLGCMALGFSALFLLTIMAKQANEDRKQAGKQP